MTIRGGCLCGAVRYEIRGRPLFGVYCHCRDCQRASGTGHVPVMGVKKSDFHLAGESAHYGKRGGSGLRAIRHFCPTCGSLLFGTPEVAPDLITIYAGSLDDPSVFEPELVQFTHDRAAWDQTAGDLPEFVAAAPRRATPREHA